MKEIGSFIPIDSRDSGEYYTETSSVLGLNSARTAIYHACRLMGCQKIKIPYYLCPSVKNFLQKKRIDISYYSIDRTFEPINVDQQADEALLIVNYFGFKSIKSLKNLVKKYNNVIIDNSAGFFCDPIKDAYNIYSLRKFFGVPDGSYIIGEHAERFSNEYKLDYSSPTSMFLFQSIEDGTRQSYAKRMENEKRIDNSDILLMSKLTRYLLKGIDYEMIKEKRRENFDFAHRIFKKMNLIDPFSFSDKYSIPMVYPLVIEKSDATDRLTRNNIFVGRLWNDVLKYVDEGSFEAWLSRYLIPVPIDHRYDFETITHINTILNKK